MYSDLRFGCQIGTFGDVKRAIEYATMIDSSGFEVVTVPDHVFHPASIARPPWDAFTTLAATATKTKRVKLSSGVSDVIRRHPATIAQQVSTLDHISNGRAMLSLGAGEQFNFTPTPDIDWSHPVPRLREAIQVIRMLWESSKEHPAHFNGRYFRLLAAYHTLKPTGKVPIYVGGYGPKMKELTAGFGDGWIPWVESPETYAKGLGEIRSYRSTFRASSPNFDPALMVFASIDTDGQKAREAMRARTRWSLSVRTRLLKDLGYPDLAKRSVDISRAKFFPHEVTRVESLARDIPDSVVDSVMLAGTVDEVIDQIKRYYDSGVRLLVINPNVERGQFERTMSAFQQTIIPQLKDTGSMDNQ